VPSGAASIGNLACRCIIGGSYQLLVGALPWTEIRSINRRLPIMCGMLTGPSCFGVRRLSELSCVAIPRLCGGPVRGVGPLSAIASLHSQGFAQRALSLYSMTCATRCPGFLLSVIYIVAYESYTFRNIEASHEPDPSVVVRLGDRGLNENQRHNQAGRSRRLANRPDSRKS